MHLGPASPCAAPDPGYVVAVLPTGVAHTSRFVVASFRCASRAFRCSNRCGECLGQFSIRGGARVAWVLHSLGGASPSRSRGRFLTAILEAITSTGSPGHDQLHVSHHT